MPKPKIKILRANHTGLSWVTTMGSRERVHVPKAIRGLLKKGEKVKVTIERIESQPRQRKEPIEFEKK